MDSALVIHRLHFAFTITYHYIFPQLTMGLAPLIVIFKSLAIRKGDERYNKAARFWAKIFAINFLFGVITGVPMEFQFGTNWAKFSQYAGGVIATALAMERVFAFFLESSFLGLFLFGEKRFGARIHWLAAFMVFVGSWLSGDRHGQLVAKYQPTTLAAMEGLFHTEAEAPIVLVGQPDTDRQALDNPIYVPEALSFLTHRRWETEVNGLNAFPRDNWPDNIPLLYYCYHIMVGLGTIFIAITVTAASLLWRKRLFSARWMLWILMLSF